MKRIIPVIIFAIGLMSGSWLALPAAEAAGWHCPFTYVVSPGDTLSGIAARAGANVWFLARLNGLWNIHQIYTGQRLCLPGPITPPAAPFASSFNLKVEYKFDDEDDPNAEDWTLGRNQIAGRSLSYPPVSGDHLLTYSDTVKLEEESVSSASTLLFWLARTDSNADTYTLVAIGDPRPLLELQMEMTPTQKITDIIPSDPENVPGVDCPIAQSINELSVSGKKQVLSLRAELVAGNNLFIPVNITQINYHQKAEYATLCYDDVGFAVHRAAGGYQLRMVMTDDGTIGPPGWRWRQHCRNWRGGGWWSRWRRSWWGC